MDDGSLLRILVATDIHLGKHENHPIRGVDSFEAFSEVMQIAKSTKPDILLLGGDLFDNINPSMKALYSCLRELKDVVFDESEGDDSIQIEVEGYQPNYLNKNLNIRLPIFSVHGNHDYPEELDGRSVFDLLQESNYINYIGRHKNTEVVHVEPLIISKGTTKVALYAMGYINTVKLSRLFERKKITFANPPEDTFNIMLIHQNRFKGKRPGADYEQCVHPSNLPKWINLLIWCH
jgi:double-strand break repair protein MRE11